MKSNFHILYLIRLDLSDHPMNSVSDERCYVKGVANRISTVLVVAAINQLQQVYKGIMRKVAMLLWLLATASHIKATCYSRLKLTRLIAGSILF